MQKGVDKHVHDVGHDDPQQHDGKYFSENHATLAASENSTSIALHVSFSYVFDFLHLEVNPGSIESVVRTNHGEREQKEPGNVR